MMALLVTAICVMATVMAVQAFVLIMIRNQLAEAQGLLVYLDGRLKKLEKEFRDG